MDIGQCALEGVVVSSLFWRDKRVFLTGHTGFKGSWLSLLLQYLGAEVTGFSLEPPTDPSIFKVASVEDGMTSVFGDIRDSVMLTDVMRQSQPEIVFHMAAQPLVRRSYLDPLQTYSTNVMGTVHLLDAVRQISSVRSVVNVTTDKCYENREWAWGYRENDRLGGFDPYSSSKSCSELVTGAYRSSYFHPSKYNDHKVGVATARAGNVIGGGDWAEDRLIPDLLRSIQSGRPVTIRNPKSVRPWQHVLEPLRGYLVLSEALYFNGSKFGEAFNFGPSAEDAKPVQWIVEEFCARWGVTGGWTLDNNQNNHESNCLRLDCSKASLILGWDPFWDLAQSLQAVIDWHRAHQDGQDMRAFSLQQLDGYLSQL